MHEKSAFVFWTTLGLFLLVLFSVSYVGVYLTYIAIPLIVLAGLVMMMTKPNPETQETYDQLKKEGRDLGDATSKALKAFEESLDEFTRDMNEKNRNRK